MVRQERRRYRFTLQEDMLGTVPSKKDLFTKYVANKNTQEDEVVEDKENGQAGYTTFYQDEKGVYLYDFHIKGFLKEAGNVMKDMVEAVKPAKVSKRKKGDVLPPPPESAIDEVVMGVKNLKSKFDNFVFVFPRKIFLQEKVDGVFERPLRAMTPLGPRVALAASDYVKAGVSFEVEIALLPHKELTWDLIENVLDYGELKGLGQFRNGSFGRFTWERIDGPAKA